MDKENKFKDILNNQIKKGWYLDGSISLYYYTGKIVDGNALAVWNQSGSIHLFSQEGVRYWYPVVDIDSYLEKTSKEIDLVRKNKLIIENLANSI